MTPDEVLAELAPILRTVLDVPTLDVHPTLTAADVPSWDSFNNVNIIVATEMKYNIQFTTAEIESFSDVGDIVNCIISKL